LENFVRKKSENFLKNWVFGQPLECYHQGKTNQEVATPLESRAYRKE
jgi:hypothetical protein